MRVLAVCVILFLLPVPPALVQLLCVLLPVALKYRWVRANQSDEPKNVAVRGVAKTSVVANEAE